MVGIIWALHACESVNVFGFGIDPPPAPLRYYDGGALTRAAERGEDWGYFRSYRLVQIILKLLLVPTVGSPI